MSCVESFVSVAFPFSDLGYFFFLFSLFVRLIDWYPPGEGKGRGKRGRGRRGRGVPRSLGDVLDDKRGIRVDNSGRRRRDVQNM